MTDKLHVEFESTPAAWCAYYDPEGYIGRGNTREEAVTELLEETDERWRQALDERDTARRELAMAKAVVATSEAACDDAQRRLAEAVQDTERLRFIGESARVNAVMEPGDPQYETASEHATKAGQHFGALVKQGVTALDAMRSAIDAIMEEAK